MNISHVQKNEQKNDDEYNYIISTNAARNNKSNVAPTEILLGKVLALLDDNSPNYILGYN